MKHNVISAVVLAVALIAAGFLFGVGRYSMMRVNEKTVIRLDRWTGNITACPLYPGSMSSEDAEFLEIGVRSICSKQTNTPQSNADKNTVVENLSVENLVVDSEINTSR